MVATGGKWIKWALPHLRDAGAPERAHRRSPTATQDPVMDPRRAGPGLAQIPRRLGT